MTELQILNNLIDRNNNIDTLTEIVKLYPNQVVFSSSLGLEDQVITDIILTNKLPIRIFTLDTGRMFEESYKNMVNFQAGLLNNCYTKKKLLMVADIQISFDDF